ncbi:MAG: DNA repair protein RecN, partial [Mycobacteriaceae bacterium]|nr:DNA repair protein RecN [Mycobacteriaceae bacterium]
MLTGETGAGKTMVVTGLHLLSGARADAGRVRLGARRAMVEGRFSTDGLHFLAASAVDDVLESCGGERDEDGSVIVVRSVGSDGRSRAYLGGRVVPAGVLGEFTDALLTVHGQNDQLRLQRPDQQRDALDAYAADGITPLLAEYRVLRKQWLELRTELGERTSRSRELALESDRLTQSLAEIDGVAPEPAEDQTIVTEVRRLSDLDSLRESATGAHAALAGAAAQGFGEGEGALDLLGSARARVEVSEDPALTALVPRLDEAIAVLTDVATDLSGYLTDLPADPGRLDTLLQRQAELKTLTRKYAPDIDGVIAWADEARSKLAKLDVSEDALSELAGRVTVAADAVRVTAEKLTAARTAA